jgi:DNA-binding NarL/FixJ family response regulator
VLFLRTPTDTKPVNSALHLRMSTSKPLKVLLVEDDLEHEHLLTEVLIEMDENRQWCNWRTASLVHVEKLVDALDCLRSDCFDVVLLNLTLPDSPVLLDSFHKVNAHARGAPIIVLADEEDLSLANLLLREGAQDVLLKSELECAPLARSLRCAIARQHRVTLLEPSHFEDDLTGALTRPCFLYLGSHYVKLTRLTRVPLLLASIEISELPGETAEHREALDLLLLRAAEVLGSAFGPPALIGRIGRNRFGLMTAGLTETTLEALLNRAALAIESAARGAEWPFGTVRFSAAQVQQDVSLDEMLGQDGNEFAGSTHARAKTAMLAD